MRWVSAMMLGSPRSDRRVPWILAAICAGAFVGAWLMTRGEYPLRPDTASYLYFDPSRSIGYPIFLWIVRQLTGQVLLAVPVQMLLLAASLFLLGLSFHHFARRPALSIAFQLLIIANPELWKFSAGLITEALATSIVALWSAQLLRLLRRRTPAGILLLAILCVVGTLVKPSLVPLFVGAGIMALLSASNRDRWRGLAAVGVALILTIAATPLTNYLIHGSSKTASPVARGLLQHSLFCAPSTPPADPDAAFVERQAALVRGHIDKAPPAIHSIMKQLYSGELRFGLIIPTIGRRHGLESGWQTDPILLRIAGDRISSNPRCYAGSALTSYFRMATYDTSGTASRFAKIVAFLEEHPPVQVPHVPLLAGDERIAQRAAAEIGVTRAAFPGMPRIEAPPARPIILIIGARLFLTTAALAGLAAMLILAIRPRRSLESDHIIVAMAALGAVFHGVLIITGLVELALTRYTVALWPVTCSILGLLAIALLDRFSPFLWRPSEEPA